MSTLIEKGHAYEIDGDVYFDVLSFPEYGKLSKQSIDELQAESPHRYRRKKETAAGFCSLESQQTRRAILDSPWGSGRPGWHIECSAMSTKYLGETIDIHGGGSDLIFPHHENEIAQSECASGCQFVKYWLHNAYLMIDKEKMSKSLGNFMTVHDVRKKFNPLVVRFFLLSAHYRSPINFSGESLEQSQSALERINNCYSELTFALKNRKAGDKDSLLERAVRRGTERFHGFDG